MTFNFGFLQQFFPLHFFFNLIKIRGNRKARSKRAQCFISALPPPPQHEGEEPACMQANCIKNIKGRERKYTYLYLLNVIFAFLHISKSLIWVLICFCVQLSACQGESGCWDPAPPRCTSARRLTSPPVVASAPHCNEAPHAAGLRHRHHASTPQLFIDGRYRG